MHFSRTPLPALLPNQFHFDAFIRQFNFSIFLLRSVIYVKSVWRIASDTVCHILGLISSGLIVFHAGLFLHFPSHRWSSKNGSHRKPLTSCHLLYVLTHAPAFLSAQDLMCDWVEWVMSVAQSLNDTSCLATHNTGQPPVSAAVPSST